MLLTLHIAVQFAPSFWASFDMLLIFILIFLSGFCVFLTVVLLFLLRHRLHSIENRLFPIVILKTREECAKTWCARARNMANEIHVARSGVDNLFKFNID